MPNFITGVGEGVQAGTQLMYGQQQAQAETQTLSAKAQESQLALKEHQQAYGARMALYSAEKAFSVQNSDINLSTLKGQGQMLDQLANNPDVKNNPIAMHELFQQKRENLKSQQEETKNNLTMRVEQTQDVSDTLNRALSDPTNPDGWKEALSRSGDNPAMQMQIAKAQTYFNSKEYTSLSPDKQLLQQREFLRHFETAKAKMQAAQGVSNTIIQSDRAAEAVRKDKASEDLRAKAIAAARERTDSMKKKETEKKEADFISQDAKQRKATTDAVQKIETKQREILSSVGLASDKDKSGFWMFKKGLEDHPDAKAAFDQLEVQKAQRVRDFNNYKLDVIRKQGKAPTSGPGSAKAEPVEITSEEVANTMPKGVWIKLGDKIGQVQ